MALKFLTRSGLCLALSAAMGLTAMSAPMDAYGAPAPGDPVVQLHAGLLSVSRKGWPTDRDRIAPLLRRYVDADAIARRVLGAEGAAASRSQRLRLAATLMTRLENQILRGPAPDPNDGFAVTSVRAIGKSEWLVATRSLQSSPDKGPEPVVLAWRIGMRLGAPVIIDTLRDGQSLATLQHEDFLNGLRGHDIEWVITRMERRVALPAGQPSGGDRPSPP